MVQYKNILVIQTAFIGDAILASSLLEKLHHALPNAKISILVRKGNESLYENHPFLTQTLYWNKQQNKILNLFTLLKTIRKNKYDCIINCHRFASSGFLSAFSGAKHIAGYKQNPFSFMFNKSVKHQITNGIHEIERYNQLIEDFTDHIIFKPKLYPSTNDVLAVKELQQKDYVCMAPASAWFTKQLPQSKWIELINSLNESKQVYLVGAPSDKDMCDQILIACKNHSVKNLCGKLSLLQTQALMAGAQMNYVNDSAPLHLASSSNAPVTAFFLSTIPLFGFGPLSTNSIIKEVRNLSCRPCGIHGYKTCPKSHFKCGNNMVLE